MKLDFAGTAVPMAAADVPNKAAELKCDVNALYAVADTEARGHGFLPDGRPQMLYEAHVFGTRTGHKWDRKYPNISAPHWNRSLYGAAGAHQYMRLAVAIELNREAALASASWGMFQIMGFNFHSCGFASVEDFVQAMLVGERQHLDAFAKLVVQFDLVRSLQTPPNFTRFATIYNGTGQVDYYASRMHQNYTRRLVASTPKPQASMSRATHPEPWHAS